jgi:hypothetical protein
MSTYLADMTEDLTVEGQTPRVSAPAAAESGIADGRGGAGGSAAVVRW